MRAQRMSPKMPASVMPMASTTAMQPSGIASIAVRVEIGEDQDSGVARSSRAGTKRSVKAGPTRRGRPGRSGRAPRIQMLRRPFFSRTVVMVAVVMPARVLRASGDSDMETDELRMGGKERAHLAGCVPCVKGQQATNHAGPQRCYAPRYQGVIASPCINLLDLRAHLREAGPSGAQ